MPVTKETIRQKNVALEFGEKLQALFGQPFDVWLAHDGEWISSNGSNCAAQREQIALRDSPEGDGFFQCKAREIAQFRYAVSVPYQAGAEKFIGFAEIESTNDHFPLALAKAAQTEMQQSQQIDHLCSKSSQLAVQVTRDLEKLAFLRQMADCLEISNDRQLRDLVEYFVPMLPTSIDCEWVAFIGSSDLKSRRDCFCGEQNTIISAGQGVADQQSLVRIVAEFGDQAMSQPYINNGLAGEEFGIVRQVILTRIFKRERHWGWLLAANRNQPKSLGIESKPCEFGATEASVVNSSALVIATHAHNVELIHQKEDLVVNVVRTLVTTIEAKDQYTRGHSERVAKFGRLLAVQLGLSRQDADRIYMSGLLHDVGKVGVPDATLSKPSNLTTEEFEQIKRHPEIGWQMLQGLEPLKGVLPGVLHHHERMDGKGYPDGLTGKDIPLDGRILAVADAYDAMTSHRAYRKGLTQEQAEDILREGAGIQWDGAVIEALFAIMPEVIKIRQSYRKKSMSINRR